MEVGGVDGQDDGEDGGWVFGGDWAVRGCRVSWGQA